MAGAAMTKLAHFGEISRKPVSEMVTRTRIDNYMNRRVFLANFMRYDLLWHLKTALTLLLDTSQVGNMSASPLATNGLSLATSFWGEAIRQHDSGPPPSLPPHAHATSNPAVLAMCSQTPHILPISAQHRAPGSNRFTNVYARTECNQLAHLLNTHPLEAVRMMNIHSPGASCTRSLCVAFRSRM